MSQIKQAFCSTIADLDDNFTAEHLNIYDGSCEILVSYIKYFQDTFGLKNIRRPNFFFFFFWKWIYQKLLETKAWHFHWSFLPSKWIRICNLGEMHEKKKYWLGKMWRKRPAQSCKDSILSTHYNPPLQIRHGVLQNKACRIFLMWNSQAHRWRKSRFQSASMLDWTNMISCATKTKVSVDCSVQTEENTGGTLIITKKITHYICLITFWS